MRPGYHRQLFSRTTALMLLGLTLSGGALTGCGGGSSDDQSAKQLLELQQAREEGKKQAQDEARQKSLAETAEKLRQQVSALKKDGSTKKSQSNSSSGGTRNAAATSGGGSGGSSSKSCGNGITANSVTSCPFALAVRDAYYSSGQGSSVSAYSEATGRAYDMSCTTSGATTCRGGNNAQVTFP